MKVAHIGLVVFLGVALTMFLLWNIATDASDSSTSSCVNLRFSLPITHGLAKANEDDDVSNNPLVNAEYVVIQLRALVRKVYGVPHTFDEYMATMLHVMSDMPEFDEAFVDVGSYVKKERELLEQLGDWYKANEGDTPPSDPILAQISQLYPTPRVVTWRLLVLEHLSSHTSVYGNSATMNRNILLAAERVSSLQHLQVPGKDFHNKAVYDSSAPTWRRNIGDASRIVDRFIVGLIKNGDIKIESSKLKHAVLHYLTSNKNNKAQEDLS